MSLEHYLTGSSQAHHHHHDNQQHDLYLGRSYTATHHYPGDRDGCEDPGAWRPPNHEKDMSRDAYTGNLPDQIERSSRFCNHESARRRNQNQHPPQAMAEEHRHSTGTRVTGRDDSLDEEKPKRLSWKQRVKHVTWAWFTLTMATGGIANVLHHGKTCYGAPHTSVLQYLLTLVDVY